MEIHGTSTNQLRIGVLGHLFEPPLLGFCWDQGTCTSSWRPSPRTDPWQAIVAICRNEWWDNIDMQQLMVNINMTWNSWTIRDEKTNVSHFPFFWGWRWHNTPSSSGASTGAQSACSHWFRGYKGAWTWTAVLAGHIDVGSSARNIGWMWVQHGTTIIKPSSIHQHFHSLVVETDHSQSSVVKRALFDQLFSWQLSGSWSQTASFSSLQGLQGPGADLKMRWIYPLTWYIHCTSCTANTAVFA